MLNASFARAVTKSMTEPRNSEHEPALQLLVRLGFATFLLVSPPVLAVAVAPPLNTAASYTILGTNSVPTAGTVTCTGAASTINGDVGSTFTSITNSGCTITGAVIAPVPGSVVTDFNNAYSALDSLNPSCDAAVPAASATLAPGVYCSAAATTLGAGVVFTLSGTATDVWVFKIGTGGTGALTGNSFTVLMAGTAQACNVYWGTAGAVTMTTSDFQGTLLSGDAITMTGGSYVGRAMATTDVTVTDTTPITFAGCTAPASITVNKNFIPSSAATVPVALSCTSGTVTTTPLNAAVGAPAVFQVTGASVGATCTATETVPGGYTANQVNCVGVALNGNCTITNTLNSASITVNKNFIPSSAATVPVALACTSGTVTTTPLNAAVGAPAVFQVTGASAGATCTATETVPGGYTANQASCVAMALNGNCTITNTLLLPRARVANIPTMSQWTYVLLGMILVAIGWMRFRQR
jgi:hypothetical protein